LNECPVAPVEFIADEIDVDAVRGGVGVYYHYISFKINLSALLHKKCIVLKIFQIMNFQHFEKSKYEKSPGWDTFWNIVWLFPQKLKTIQSQINF
jgi:hypothetical protein